MNITVVWVSDESLVAMNFQVMCFASNKGGMFSMSWWSSYYGLPMSSETVVECGTLYTDQV